jgi:hypothetical protein
MQHTIYHPISLRLLLILSSHLRLGHSEALFPSGITIKILYHAMYEAHFVPCDLGERYRTWFSSASCNFNPRKSKYSDKHPVLFIFGVYLVSLFIICRDTILKATVMSFYMNKAAYSSAMCYVPVPNFKALVSLPSQKFVCWRLIIDLRELGKYDVRTAANGMKLVPKFHRICQLFQSWSWGRRQYGNLDSISTNI